MLYAYHFASPSEMSALQSLCLLYTRGKYFFWASQFLTGNDVTCQRAEKVQSLSVFLVATLFTFRATCVLKSGARPFGSQSARDTASLQNNLYQHIYIDRAATSFFPSCSLEEGILIAPLPFLFSLKSTLVAERERENGVSERHIDQSFKYGVQSSSKRTS